MRRELLVPKLGLTMTEGVLVEWMVRPGQAFKAGQSIFVIESEKAANEIDAEADGQLLEITAEVGATLPCGTVIGYWEDGVAGEAMAAESTLTRPVVQVVEMPAAVVKQPLQPVGTTGSRIPVTPLARRIAQQRGVDLTFVTGSGPRGRVRARDVLAAVDTASLPGAAKTGAWPRGRCHP